MRCFVVFTVIKQVMLLLTACYLKENRKSRINQFKFCFILNVGLIFCVRPVLCLTQKMVMPVTILRDTGAAQSFILSDVTVF